jgi:hypothetical protein
VLKHIPLNAIFDAPYKAAVKKAINIADLRTIAKSRAHKVSFSDDDGLKRSKRKASPANGASSSQFTTLDSQISRCMSSGIVLPLALSALASRVAHFFLNAHTKHTHHALICLFIPKTSKCPLTRPLPALTLHTTTTTIITLV